MNRHIYYWAGYIVAKDQLSYPVLRYKDVKDIPVLLASIGSYCKNYRNICALFTKQEVFYSTGLKEITLSEALKLYKESPHLFKRTTLLHLYSFISLYDPNIRTKIEQRLKRYE